MAIPDPKTLVQGEVNRIKSDIFSFDAPEFGSALRSKNLPPGAEPPSRSFVTGSFDDPSETKDWRVKLSLPRGGSFPSQDIEGSEKHPLTPLYRTNGMVFPYTPNVYITYSANYDNLHPTHSNYPFPIYQNSAVDQFVITGEFTVENSSEGLYWIAANHYLRSITKMAYGNTPNQGSPPPVVRLNGYGDFVFNDVPVIVQQYTVELADNVDYIQCDIGKEGSWAPTRSTISVTLQPAYSRNSISQFSLKDFVNGTYINEGPKFI